MKKYWIDESNGYPVMMTTTGKQRWGEAARESWKSCLKAGSNYTLYLILGIVCVGAVLTYIIHSLVV